MKRGFLALICGAGVMSLPLACTGGDDSSDASPEAAGDEVGAVDDAAGGQAVTQPPTPTKQVVSLYDALNAGDWAAAAALWPTGDLTVVQWMAEQFRERTSVACAPGDASSVVCDEFVGNDLFDPARVAARFTVRYELADGVVTDRQVVTVGEDAQRFLGAFGEWLRAVDPQLHAEAWRADSPRFPVQAATDADRMRARLDEFLEQSADYPAG